jgi:hypothetical protein
MYETLVGRVFEQANGAQKCGRNDERVNGRENGVENSGEQTSERAERSKGRPKGWQTSLGEGE